jgi:hypothetical protein
MGQEGTVTRAARLFGVLLMIVEMIPAAARTEPLGPSTADLLKLNITAARHPSDDAVILYRGVAISVDPQGKVTRRVREIQRLLSDHAIAERGDPRVAYDTTRQELSIDVCRTFMKDGTEISATPHAFNRVTPERVASCPDRCGLQEMVISYLGLERGCLTELDYTLTDRLSWRPWAEGIEDLGDAAPLLAGEVRISADSLKTAFVGIPEPKGDAPGIWEYGPLPAFPDEGGITPRERIPHLVYSNCRSWEALGAWMRGRFEEAVPDSAIRAWAQGPMENGRPPIDGHEILARVARLIGEGTNHADDTPVSWWLPIRSPGRTFDTSCGNLLDRAALACAALRASGIAAQPRLVCASSTTEPPALSHFDDICIDTESDGSLSVARGKVVLEMDDSPWGSSLFLDHPNKSTGGVWSVRSSLSIRIHEEDDGSVRGEAAIHIGRGGEAGYGDLKTFLQSLAAGYAEKGELAGFSVEKLYKSELEATFSFTGKGLGDSLGGGRRLIRIPSAPGMPGNVLPAGMNLRRRVRATPIILPFASAVETVDLRLELSPRSRIRILPAGGSLVGPGASLETEVERVEGAIRIHRAFEVGSSNRHDRSIAAAEYPAFRATLLRRTAPSPNSIVIERSAEQKK